MEPGYSLLTSGYSIWYGCIEGFYILLVAFESILLLYFEQKSFLLLFPVVFLLNFLCTTLRSVVGRGEAEVQ